MRTDGRTREFQGQLKGLESGKPVLQTCGIHAPTAIAIDLPGKDIEWELRLSEGVVSFGPKNPQINTFGKVS